MHGVLRFPISTVGNEDSFEQHEERSDDCLVAGEVRERHGTDERVVSGIKRFQSNETSLLCG